MRKANCVHNTRIRLFPFWQKWNSKKKKKKKEKNVTDRKKDGRIGFAILFLKLCTHPVHRSQRVGCCSLSTQKQIAAVILDLLTKPCCTNTKLITSTHICSNVHRQGLSGQGLTAGEDCFVCVCVRETDNDRVCLCVCTHTCASAYLCTECVCTSCIWFVSHILKYTWNCRCVFSKHTFLLLLLTACLCLCAHICECVSHSSCRCFISLPRLGEAAQFGMHRDSYNLTNWNGGGFGLNLS